MFEEELETPEKLLPHLDKRAGWERYKTHSIAQLHAIAERCLEPRRNRRPELVEIIPQLEQLRQCATEAQLRCVTGGHVPAAQTEKECVICFAGLSSAAGWVMLQPCGHVCVCSMCVKGLVECPVCRKAVSGSLPVFL